MAHPQFGLGQPQFVDRGVGIAIAAHCRIAQRQNPAGIGAGKTLQRMRPLGGKQQRLAGQIGDVFGIHARLRRVRHQTLRLLPCRQRGLMRGRGGFGRLHRRGYERMPLEHIGRQKAVGIVEAWPKDLPAWNILEGGRDAPTGHKLFLPHGFRDAKARLGGAPGPQQQHRLVKIAPRLRQRQRGQIGGVKRGFAHQPVDQQRQSLAQALDPLGIDHPQFGPVKPFGLFDGTGTAARRHISHHKTSIRVERGRPITCAPHKRKRSNPAG